jgi:diguanylate cyclase (GGDEF)-like protein/putative nucleotidyltransferase with HDIG domain
VSTDRQILIVDPDADFSVELSRRLSEAGLSALTTDSVGSALTLLEHDGNSISVVVSEMVFPGGTSGGLVLIEEVRRRCWRQPVIFVSATGRGEWIKQAIWAGAYEYYDKPVDSGALIETIQMAVRVGHEHIQPERRSLTRHGFDPQIGPCLRDPLTGVASHRCVLEMIPKIRHYFHEKRLPVSLCMIDIDRFRELNAQRGLSVCDQVLIEFTRRIRRMIRFNDIIARYGGDEFVLLLPGATSGDAHALSQRIMDAIKESPLRIDGEVIRLPVCVGVVQLDPTDSTADMEFVDRAIEAVHYAKLAGSETVVTWQPGMIHETLLWDSHEASQELSPDMESVNIMAWRFRELNRQLASMTNESLGVLVAAVEARDPYTKNHSVRVAALSRFLADQLGLPARQAQVIHSASLLHDIGKIGIPDAILTKPGRLTSDEFDLIRQHPTIGVNILQQTRSFTAESRLIRYHHERVDGRGYPDGLKGDDIPFGSRIIHVADSVEAMLTRRSYKEPYSAEFVVTELRKGAGTQFDEIIAHLCADLIERGVLLDVWSDEHIAGQLQPSASSRG